MRLPSVKLPEIMSVGRGVLMSSTGFAVLSMEVRYFFSFREVICPPLVLKTAV
jgi:hypothetical protein